MTFDEGMTFDAGMAFDAGGWPPVAHAARDLWVDTALEWGWRFR
jgi:hypothetical protein